MRNALIGVALATLVAPFESAHAEQRTVWVGYEHSLPTENMQLWSGSYQPNCALSYFQFLSREKTAQFAVQCPNRKGIYTFQTGDWVMSAFATECSRTACASLVVRLRLDSLNEDGSAVIDVTATVVNSQPRPAGS